MTQILEKFPALLIDTQGRGETVDRNHPAPLLTGGLLWVRMWREDDDGVAWLKTESGLDPLVCAALLADETRPRFTEFDHGLMVILRGVNLTPGEDPTDMVSVRVWIEESRVISVQLRPLVAIEDIIESTEQNNGPPNPGEFIRLLASRIAARLEPVVIALGDRLDDLEDQILDGHGRDMRAALGTIRREAITLKRFVAPQREALSALSTSASPWLDAKHLLHMREVTNRVARSVEELDAVREKAAVVSEEISNQLAERMNSAMYLLSIVAGVFLPLGLITGLLGINVGGIPGVDVPWAFAAVTGLLVVLAAAEILFLKFRRWF